MRAQALPATRDRPVQRVLGHAYRQAVLLALVHVALSGHTAPRPAPRATHHTGTNAVGECSGERKLDVSGWGRMTNASYAVTEAKFSAREYLTGVQVFWNEGDALFPDYASAVLVHGGRAGSGAIQNDTWMIPITRTSDSMLSLGEASSIEVGGAAAPARWGHTAVWTGRGADKAETWATPRSYPGLIDEGDDLVSAQGHPIGDTRHTISGKLQSWASTSAPCVGGNTVHQQTGLDCSSAHGRAGGCSCVVLEVHSRVQGTLDADSVVSDPAASLYPSLWSGRRLQIIAGVGQGYSGILSFNAAGKYNVAPAFDFQVGLVGMDSPHFVITEAEAMWTPSAPLDTMWMFGGRDAESQLTNDVYALTTAVPASRDGVIAADARDNKYSPDGVEDFTRSTNGWFYTRSALTDFGSPLRPMPAGGPGDIPIVQKGPPATSVCGAFGSLLGGFQLLGPDTVVSKQYITAAAHTSVRVSFDFIKIDFWDGQIAELWLDGSVVWSRQFHSHAFHEVLAKTAMLALEIGDQTTDTNVTLEAGMANLEVGKYIKAASGEYMKVVSKSTDGKNLTVERNASPPGLTRGTLQGAAAGTVSSVGATHGKVTAFPSWVLTFTQNSGCHSGRSKRARHADLRTRRSAWVSGRGSYAGKRMTISNLYYSRTDPILLGF